MYGSNLGRLFLYKIVTFDYISKQMKRNLMMRQ